MHIQILDWPDCFVTTWPRAAATEMALAQRASTKADTACHQRPQCRSSNSKPHQQRLTHLLPSITDTFPTNPRQNLSQRLENALTKGKFSYD